MRSNAQVSLANTGAPRSFPRTRGRKPSGSRTAMIESWVRKRSEYAPRTCASARWMRSTAVPSRSRAMRWRSSSVSEEPVKIAPCSSRDARSSSALTRLPLCATAMGPTEPLKTNGCAFSMRDCPAVE